MLYVRGHPNDYDRWEHDYGCTGWGGAEMWSYFRKAENNESLTGPHHGNAGKLAVSDNRYRHPLTQAFIRAGQQMGWEYRNDYNDGRQDGVGYYQTTTFNGERGSSAARYIRPLIGHPNLDLQVNAHVVRIEIEQGRATGVTYRKNGQLITAHVRGEVILSAGAIGSPRSCNSRVWALRMCWRRLGSIRRSICQ
jgi:choline dehydrogenase